MIQPNVNGYVLRRDLTVDHSHPMSKREGSICQITARKSAALLESGFCYLR
jgi:hypothetical protein